MTAEDLETRQKLGGGWRLGNLAPVFEPIAWFLKPYKIGGTLADNVIQNRVGAMNVDDCLIDGSSPTNILEFGFRPDEKRFHEAQKPVRLVEFLIRLTTREGQTVLDPFMGSGTTAVAAARLKRHFIGFEIDPGFHNAALKRLDAEKGSTYSLKNRPVQRALFEDRRKRYG